jgi:hypothetical protein
MPAEHDDVTWLRINVGDFICESEAVFEATGKHTN